jgi:hypothetical protein
MIHFQFPSIAIKSIIILGARNRRKNLKYLKKVQLRVKRKNQNVHL